MRTKLLGAVCLILACCLVVFMGTAADKGETDSKTATKKHTSVRLFHKFETTKAKDNSVQQFLDVFGHQEGVLLASTTVRYTWQLGSKTIELEDDTRRTGVPSILMRVYETPE